MSQLTEDEKARGVIACSAGNHAQGVALAAQKNGIKAVICLPDGAPISKVEATRSYGAEICLVEGVYDDAYAKALRLRDEKGYTFIHPFNDPDVIAGRVNRFRACRADTRYGCRAGTHWRRGSYIGRRCHQQRSECTSLYTARHPTLPE